MILVFSLFPMCIANVFEKYFLILLMFNRNGLVANLEAPVKNVSKLNSDTETIQSKIIPVTDQTSHPRRFKVIVTFRLF